MTTAGQTPARKALVAGTGAYRSPAQGSRPRPRRRATHPTMIQDLSGKAPVRRCTRSRPLVARGQQAPIVTVAMARERVGGLGAMATPVPVAAYSRKDRSPLHPPRSRFPTCISRGAAPVWCHPRQREEAWKGYACRERGRPPTEARKGGANPRRAAGSTVAWTPWLGLYCRPTQYSGLRRLCATARIRRVSDARSR